jgi:hypothetical protein
MINISVKLNDLEVVLIKKYVELPYRGTSSYGLVSKKICMLDGEIEWGTIEYLDQTIAYHDSIYMNNQLKNSHNTM